MKFKKEYLIEELDLPYNAIENKVVWSILRQIIFQDKDGKYYRTTYSVGSPWQDKDEIECTEVELKEVMVKKWVVKE